MFFLLEQRRGWSTLKRGSVNGLGSAGVGVGWWAAGADGFEVRDTESNVNEICNEHNASSACHVCPEP